MSPPRCPFSSQEPCQTIDTYFAIMYIISGFHCSACTSHAPLPLPSRDNLVPLLIEENLLVLIITLPHSIGGSMSAHAARQKLALTIGATAALVLGTTTANTHAIAAP